MKANKSKTLAKTLQTICDFSAGQAQNTRPNGNHPTGTDPTNTTITITTTFQPHGVTLQQVSPHD